VAMSAPRNPKTAALEALIEAHAIELKLPTVRRRFREFAQDGVREQQTPVAYLAALLDAEIAERAARRERRRLLDARFSLIKRLEDFHFDYAHRSRRPRSPRSPKAPGLMTASKSS
jgi:DNA replication protein DnaC